MQPSRPGSVAGLQAASRASQWRDRAGISPASLFSPIQHGAPEAYMVILKEQIEKKNVTPRRVVVKRIQEYDALPFRILFETANPDS